MERKNHSLIIIKVSVGTCEIPEKGEENDWGHGKKGEIYSRFFCLVWFIKVKCVIFLQ